MLVLHLRNRAFYDVMEEEGRRLQDEDILPTVDDPSCKDVLVEMQMDYFVANGRVLVSSLTKLFLRPH